MHLRPQPRQFPPSIDYAPTADDFDETIRAAGDPGRDSFEVVAEIFASGWGIPRSAVPFAEDGRINLALMDA